MASPKICKKCKTVIAPGAKFCPACGAKTANNTPALIAIVLVIIVAVVAICVIVSGNPDSDKATPNATAAAKPAATPKQTSSAAIAENADISVSFEKLEEIDGIEGVCYLTLSMTSKADKEIWVYLENASVNGDMLPAVMQGVPTYIMPEKTSHNPFIISFANITAQSAAEITDIQFDIVVADRESLNEISRISNVRIES